MLRCPVGETSPDRNHSSCHGDRTRGAVIRALVAAAEFGDYSVEILFLAYVDSEVARGLLRVQKTAGNHAQVARLQEKVVHVIEDGKGSLDGVSYRIERRPGEVLCNVDQL